LFKRKDAKKETERKKRKKNRYKIGNWKLEIGNCEDGE